MYRLSSSKKVHQTIKLKQLVVLSLVFMMLFNISTIKANESHEDFIEEANTLKALGLFKGTGLGFELSRYGTRLEAAVIIVRLLGVENSAKDSDYSHPFSDVPGWADLYVGYLYHEGLTNGTGDGKYGSDVSLSPNQFLTFALRSLSYDDGKDDFELNEALNKALEVGIIDEDYKQYLNKNTEIYRDDIVAIMYNLLNQKINNQDISLIDFLISSGVTTLDKAMELGIYKQVQSITITGEVLKISNTQKAVVTETVNNYNYYVLVPFGLNEDIYTGVVKIQTERYIYECIISKEAYFTIEEIQNLIVGEKVTLTGEFATNVLEQNKNTRYIIIK